MRVTWQSATFFTGGNCLDRLQLCWQSATVLTVCNCLDSLKLCWYSATVLTVWNCLDILQLSWQSATVLTVCNCVTICNCVDSLYLCWHSATVLTVCNGLASKYIYMNMTWLMPYQSLCLVRGDCLNAIIDNIRLEKLSCKFNFFVFQSQVIGIYLFREALRHKRYKDLKAPKWGS